MTEWSAPSAIGTAGFGAGLQIGAELTDFVIILNSDAAVQAFSHGNVTLGGNLSVAAGPVGRNAEASGAVTFAAMYSYSRTKGLFAGISLEGTVLLERKDANNKLYEKYHSGSVSAKDLLSGKIQPPVEAEPLYAAIVIRTHSPAVSDQVEEMHRDATYVNPTLARGSHQTPPSSPSALSTGAASNRAPPPMAPRPHRAAPPIPSQYKADPNEGYGDYSHGASTEETYGSQPPVVPVAKPQRAPVSSPQRPAKSPNTEVYNAPRAQPPMQKPPPISSNPQRNLRPVQAPVSPTSPTYNNSRGAPKQYPQPPVSPGAGGKWSSPAAQVDHAPEPSLPPRAPKVTRALALYDFTPVESEDLGFRKGDVIEIIKIGEGPDSWWQGQINGKRGNLPGNYVELIDK